jgi:phosphohistidine phosphatase
MELYILRHGKAEKSIPEEKSDGDRLLTRTGKDEIKKIGCWLRDSGVIFDSIATSPLARAFGTAEILAYETRFPRKPDVWDCLRPGANPLLLDNALQSAGPNSVILIVGHEPMLSALVSTMIGDEGPVRIAMKKGGLAIIDRIQRDTPLKGRLLLLIDPAWIYPGGK